MYCCKFKILCVLQIDKDDIHNIDHENNVTYDRQKLIDEEYTNTCEDNNLSDSMVTKNMKQLGWEKYLEGIGITDLDNLLWKYKENLQRWQWQSSRVDQLKIVKIGNPLEFSTAN